MLKPCPFCGKVPDRVKRWEDLFFQVDYIVSCDNPGCKIRPTTPGCKSRARAVNAWNKRA